MSAAREAATHNVCATLAQLWGLDAQEAAWTRPFVREIIDEIYDKKEARHIAFGCAIGVAQPFSFQRQFQRQFRLPFQFCRILRRCSMGGFPSGNRSYSKG